MMGGRAHPPPPPAEGRASGLLIGGTGSGVGKTVVVAGLCRWLNRRGVRTAPFKPQNMSHNSCVTHDGAEISRSVAMQAWAAGVDPQREMNPVLLKPTPGHGVEVIARGAVIGYSDALRYREHAAQLVEIVDAAHRALHARFDVVVCEGAGALVEATPPTAELGNLHFARRAQLPVVLVGDIEHGGVFASLLGALALAEPPDRPLIAGFLINRFRGDKRLLADGIARLTSLSARPTLGVLPRLDRAWIDAEDEAAVVHPGPSRSALDVAVIALAFPSNLTDVDPLRCEPGVRVQLTRARPDILNADLVVLPGTKATASTWRPSRRRGLRTHCATALREGSRFSASAAATKCWGATSSTESRAR